MKRPELLYVIRHGQTDWNVAWRYQGHTDIRLNDYGRAQAVRNGMVLAAHLAAEGKRAANTSFRSSPLSRARETTELVRQACSLPAQGYRCDARFMEIAYGRWEGLTVQEIKRAFPEDFAKRRSGGTDFAPEGGESYAALFARVRTGLSELENGQVLVCHGGVVKGIWGTYLGLTDQEARALDIRQDRVFRFHRASLELI